MRTSSGTERSSPRTPTGTEDSTRRRSPVAITRSATSAPGEDGGHHGAVAVEQGRVADDLVAVGERGTHPAGEVAAGPPRHLGEEVGDGADERGARRGGGTASRSFPKATVVPSAPATENVMRR